MKRIFLFSFFLSFGLYSQDYFIVNDGIKTQDYQFNVFVNANIYSNNSIIKNATLIEKDGKIVQIGKDIEIPENSIVKDLNGNYIYPSFIEIHSSFGVKKPERRSYGRSSQYEPTRKGYYWNDHVLSDYNSMKDYSYNQKYINKFHLIIF